MGKRVDLDAFPLEQIADPALADQVEALIAEVESLRHAVGLMGNVRLDGLRPTGQAILQALLARQGHTKASLFHAVFGHRDDGGPGVKNLDTQLVHVRNWLWARGIELHGGTHGAAFRLDDAARDTLRSVIAGGADLPVMRSGRRPRLRAVGVMRAIVMALRDHGPLTAPSLSARILHKRSAVIVCLNSARKQGLVQSEKIRRSRVLEWSITSDGLAWLDEAAP